MKYKLKAFFTIILITAFWYLVASFVGSSFNPNDWNAVGKVFLVIIYFVSLANSLDKLFD
jgi:hypothetical protein